ncbi:MAG: hypothetical protein CMK59_08570, partial [Proteobacteria bacterium]|nr:hypothetical protein [Pseudomonadota bacterium]
GLLLTGERPPPPLNPALEDPLRAALSAPLSEHVELVVGVIDQGIFSCALTTFLKSYERYLPKEHTAIVLCDQAQSTSAVNFGAQWSSNPSFQEMFPIASSFNVQPIQSHLIQSQNSAESLGWNTALIAADWTNTSVVTDLIQNIPTTPLPAAPSLDFSDASEETKTEQDAIEQ